MSDTAIELLVKDLSEGIKGLGEAANALREAKEKQLAEKEIPAPPSADEIRAALMPDIKAMVDDAMPAQPRPLVNDSGPDHGFKSLAHFVRTIAESRKMNSPELTEWARKDITGASGGAGGYAVPDQFINQLLEIPMQQGVVRPRATVVPMMSDTAKIPAINATSHATNFYGGMLGYWLGEAAAITASAWTMKQVGLQVNTLATLGLVSNQWLDDNAIGSSPLIARLFGQVIKTMEDEAFLTGNASSKPQGIVGSACEVAYSRATGGDFSEADAIGMYAGWLGRPSNGVWLVNQTVIPKIFAWHDAASNNIWAPNAAPGLPGTIFGLPLIVTENLPALGTKGDVILADLSYYLIGDRQDVRMDLSTDFKFDYIETAIRLYERVDGTPWLDATYTPRKGTALSPFVVLT